jgi:hypothetical protein
VVMVFGLGVDGDFHHPLAKGLLRRPPTGGLRSNEPLPI